MITNWNLSDSSDVIYCGMEGKFEEKFVKVNSVQEACAKYFVVHMLKFEILQTTWKNKTKSIKMLDLLMKNWKLRVWCFLFHFFMRFAWFQILICEPQSIWRKLLALSWLYFVNGLGYSNFHFKFWFKIKPLNLCLHLFTYISEKKYVLTWNTENQYSLYHL